jgi:uncharacterized membrane protein
MGSRRMNQTFSWLMISFLITALITYLLIGQWIKAILLATISVLMEGIGLKFFIKAKNL